MLILITKFGVVVLIGHANTLASYSIGGEMLVYMHVTTPQICNGDNVDDNPASKALKSKQNAFVQ